VRPQRCFRRTTGYLTHTTQDMPHLLQDNGSSCIVIGLRHRNYSVGDTVLEMPHIIPLLIVSHGYPADAIPSVSDDAASTYHTIKHWADWGQRSFG